MSELPILTSGQFLARSGLSQMPEPEDGGDWAELVTANVDDGVEASVAGSYWQSGFDGFLATGDEQALAEFQGKVVAGFPLMTDPDLVEAWYFDHGPVDVAEYYRP